MTSPLMPRELESRGGESDTDKTIRRTSSNRFEWEDYQDMKREYAQLEKYMKQNGNMDRLQAKVERINANCDKHNDCASCMKGQGCGWCPVLNQCVLGNKDGPFSGVCQYYQWKQCRKRVCQKNSDCFSCLQERECGWCQTDDKCYEGGVESADCPNGWYHRSSPDNRNNLCNVFLHPLTSQSEDPLLSIYQQRPWEKPMTMTTRISQKAGKIRNQLGAIPELSYKIYVRRMMKKYSHRMGVLQRQIKAIHSKLGHSQ